MSVFSDTVEAALPDAQIAAGNIRIDMETIDLETAQTMGKINIRIDNIDVLEFNSLENTLLQYAHEN